MNSFIDVNETGCAGTAVEVFVGAADGEVCIAVIEVDGDGTDGMAEVPEDECAFAVGEFGDALHIVNVAALEEDMRERDDGCVFVDGGFKLGNVRGDVVVGCADTNDLVAIAKILLNALQDIKIGWEIERVSDDPGSVRLQCDGGCGEFEEVDGGGVTDENLSRCGADELTDLLADSRRRIPPAFVPATDEVIAPFLVHDLFGAFGGGFGHASK